ncbi:DNA-binding transcriptional regulator, LysR family [Sinosporangium album]|uniref:DNA-binding transcriptional regulator, LysR family n=1 Tax=Sinosporangium album TaxID=504805 RepID=A0A1G7ZRL7_9ACTN|nr:LysR family transcriptional regulator [Sinosporangium album]SDH11323.1 DNA-binding transcriptional regulator, LysR family [Sinosporangium album]
MELRHIRYFLAVVETGSTVKAAERELVAQPSLSRQLRRLESELGIDLFVRDSGRLHLSAAGERFLPIARDLITRAHHAQTTLRALAAGRPPRLTVAAPPTTIADVIAPFIATTTAADPFITVREELPATSYAALQRGADLAISPAPPPLYLAWHALARLPIWAYVPPHHPFHGRTHITVPELVTQPLLLLTPDHGTRRRFDHAVLDAGQGCDIAFETRVPQIAQALAAAGHGIAVVSDDPRYGLQALAVHTPHGDLAIDLFAAWDPTHYAADTLDSLARDLSAYCIATYGPAVTPTVTPAV